MRTFLRLACLMLLAAAAAVHAAQRTSSTNLADMRTVHDRYPAAMREGDATAMAALLDATFVHRADGWTIVALHASH